MLRFDVALLYFFIAFKPATAVTITNTDYSGIQTGSPFTITWTDASTLVTILLKTGNSTNVNDLKVAAIWVDLPGTSFVWTPAPILQTGLYRFELADSAVEPDFSPQFMLTHLNGFAVSSLTSQTNIFLTSAPTATSLTLKSTSTSASTTSSSPTTIQPTSTPISAENTTATEIAQSTGESSRRRRPAVIAGIVMALSFLIILTSFFAITILRDRYRRRRSAAQNDKSKATDGVISTKGTDIENGTEGGRVEMSGGLDSISSVGISSRDPSSRRPSTRPDTGEMMEPEPEPEPVEIGSSGYGTHMSEMEKAKAVELEPNQRVKFEERKRRRRRVKLEVAGLRILL